FGVFLGKALEHARGDGLVPKAPWDACQPGTLPSDRIRGIASRLGERFLGGKSGELIAVVEHRLKAWLRLAEIVPERRAPDRLICAVVEAQVLGKDPRLRGDRAHVIVERFAGAGLRGRGGVGVGRSLERHGAAGRSTQDGRGRKLRVKARPGHQIQPPTLLERAQTESAQLLVPGSKLDQVAQNSRGTVGFVWIEPGEQVLDWVLVLLAEEGAENPRVKADHAAASRGCEITHIGNGVALRGVKTRPPPPVMPADVGAKNYMASDPQVGGGPDRPELSGVVGVGDADELGVRGGRRGLRVRLLVGVLAPFLVR